MKRGLSEDELESLGAMTKQADPLVEYPGPPRAEHKASSRTLVIATLALSIGINLLAPGLALNWARRPFLGVLLEHTLVVAGRSSSDWTGHQAGLEHPDRIISINGVPVLRVIDLYPRLLRHQVGDVVTLVVEETDGAGGWQLREVDVSLMRFPLQDLVARFLTPYAISLVFLILGIWVFAVKGHWPSGRAFTLFCAFLSLGIGSYFDLISTHWLTRVFSAAVPFCAASMIHLGLVFPQERTIVGKWRILHHLPYLIALVIAAWSQVVLFDAADPRAYFVAWRWGFNYTGLAGAIFMGLLLWTRLWPATPEIRQQARIILLGSLIAFMPILTWTVVSSFLRLGVEFQEAFLFPLVLFPLFVAYAIVRHRLLDVNLVISRSLAYLVLITFIVAIFFLVLTLLEQALKVTELVSRPMVLALFVLALVLFLDPLRRHTQDLMNRVFLKGRPDYRRELEGFSRALTATLDLSRLLDMFLERVAALMRTDRGIIYLFDSETDQYTVQRTWGIPHPSTLMTVRFQENDETVGWLKASSRAVYLTSSEGYLIPTSFTAKERIRLAVLMAAVCVPFFTKGQLIGWLALGHKLTRELYNPDDLTFLTALADQVALAIENARFFEGLKRMHNELRQAYTDLDKANRQLQEMDKLKSAFIGVITHELRSPFANIAFSMQVFERYGVDHLPEKQAEQLKQLASDIASARKMVDNLVTFATLLSKQGELRPSWLDFGEMIQNTLLPLQTMSEAKGLTLYVAVPEDLPLLYGDKGRLTDAIHHLVQNAIKFTEVGEVRIRSWSAEDAIHFEVKDTGIGVPADKLDTLWEGFTQMADPLRRGVEGLGLGLALVKYVVTAHGGEVWVHSEKGVGSTFGFQVPSGNPEPPTDPTRAIRSV